MPAIWQSIAFSLLSSSGSELRNGRLVKSPGALFRNLPKIIIRVHWESIPRQLQHLQIKDRITEAHVEGLLEEDHHVENPFLVRDDR